MATTREEMEELLVNRFVPTVYSMDTESLQAALTQAVDLRSTFSTDVRGLLDDIISVYKEALMMRSSFSEEARARDGCGDEEGSERAKRPIELSFV